MNVLAFVVKSLLLTIKSWEFVNSEIFVDILHWIESSLHGSNEKSELYNVCVCDTNGRARSVITPNNKITEPMLNINCAANGYLTYFTSLV